MEQTQQDKEILQADKATPAADETESEKIVEVLNLLYANLLKAMRLMWYQLFFTGTLIILFFIAFFYFSARRRLWVPLLLRVRKLWKNLCPPLILLFHLKPPGPSNQRWRKPFLNPPW
jgi:hypothetical protein